MSDDSTITRTVIVDDEPPARRKLRSLLSREDGIEIVGECSSGRSAVELIAETCPDLVFLDIQMPGMSGFQVAATVCEAMPGPMPLIIFVTAYEQYALQAFEYSALDYLLKPVDRDRFAIALRKAKYRLRTERHQMTRDTQVRLEKLQRAPKYLERLAVKANDRVLILKVEDIDWFEAEGKYVRIHTGGGSHLLREAISTLDEKLDPSRFLRVHRSAIVNLDRIRELQPWFNGDYRVVLISGASVTLSRANKKKLSDLVGNHL
ncbi:MAG TPA: LytTR family DNA-binding domain-containing protein [Blastocatellia bacterium]